MKNQPARCWDPMDLARWCSGRWDPGPPDTLSGIGHDTRHLAPGSIYVALRGERFDGHSFVAGAFRNGAAAALVEHSHPLQAGPLLRVEDTRRALHDLARGHRSTLQGILVGITGSVGKTTVKEMLARMLSRLGPTACTRGNWNNDIGLPLSLLGMCGGDRHGVFEMGISRPGDMAPLVATARPEWAVLTLLGPVHLETFGSIEAIAREKALLPAGLTGTGGAVLSLDDPWFKLLAGGVAGRVVTVSLSGARDADYTATGMDETDGRLEVHERSAGIRQSLFCPLAGLHLLDDALRAYAAARTLGVPPQQAAAALADWRPLKGRGTRIRVGDVTCIDDAYNASPLSMRASLRAFERAPANGRKWLVLGAMRELGDDSEEAHRSLGRDAAAGPWAGLLTVGRDAAPIAEGARQAAMQTVHSSPTAGEAAAWLAGNMDSGDAILFKASRSESLERVIDALRTICETAGGGGSNQPHTPPD